jgi:hypothetical protein
MAWDVHSPGIECLVGQIGKILMHYGCPSKNLGAKFHVSYNQLVIELGLSLQPLQESFKQYHKLVAWGWLVSLWEKCEVYNIRIEMNDMPLQLPRERDKWLMWEFINLGYNLQELIWLNQVGAINVFVLHCGTIGEKFGRTVP